jgi:hypothetical protein
MQERRWQTVAIERPDGVYNLLHQRRDLSFILGVYQASTAAGKRFGANPFSSRSPASPALTEVIFQSVLGHGTCARDGL